jgi:hypothetical protein
VGTAFALQEGPGWMVCSTPEFGVPISNPGYPTDEKEIRRGVADGFKRSNYPAGFSRQMAAHW